MRAPIPISRPRRPRRLRTPNPAAKQALMEAAAELIREQGLSALRIEEVAQKAGLSVGTFYLYFQGKAELFVQIVLEYTERLRGRLKQAYGAPGGVGERLGKAHDAYVDFVLENEKGFLPFVNDTSALETDVGRLSKWVFEAHASDVLPLIQEGMRTGELRPTDPMLAAQALVGLNQHLAVYWLEHRDTCSREQLKEFVAAFTTFGLAAVQPPRPRRTSGKPAPVGRKEGSRASKREA